MTTAISETLRCRSRQARLVRRALSQILTNSEMRPRIDDVRLMLGLSKNPSAVEVEDSLEVLFNASAAHAKLKQA